VHTDSRELHTAAADDLAVRLAAVASRALIARRARGMDWGPYGDRVEECCWTALGEALDELELAQPVIYARLAQRQTGLLAQLQRELDVPPPP
jgi:hypothetical protein